MKAERNCLRNMSSSSDEEDWLGKQGRQELNQRKVSTAAQVSEKPLIRNTNHHKSQSIGGIVPNPQQAEMPTMDGQGDAFFDGNPRMSYDDVDQQRQDGGGRPGSISSARRRNQGGQNTTRDIRMSNTFADPASRTANASCQQAPSKGRPSKMSRLRTSASQSALLAKSVDKSGKLDEIIKRSQELRERRK